MTIWRMRIVCWITKATNTHSEYVILITFPLQQWLHERPSMLRHTYIACIYHTGRFFYRRGWTDGANTLWWGVWSRM